MTFQIPDQITFRGKTYAQHGGLPIMDYFKIPPSRIESTGCYRGYVMFADLQEDSALVIRKLSLVHYPDDLKDFQIDGISPEPDGKYDVIFHLEHVFKWNGFLTLTDLSQRPHWFYHHFENPDVTMLLLQEGRPPLDIKQHYMYGFHAITPDDLVWAQERLQDEYHVGTYPTLYVSSKRDAVLCRMKFRDYRFLVRDQPNEIAYDQHVKELAKMLK